MKSSETPHSHAIKDNIVNRELGSGGVLQFVEVGPATWLHSHQLTIKDNVFKRELVERGGALTGLPLFNVIFASGKPIGCRLLRFSALNNRSAPLLLLARHFFDHGKQLAGADGF